MGHIFTRKAFSGNLCFFVATIIIASSSTSVSAISEYLRTIFKENGLMFWNPDEYGSSYFDCNITVDSYDGETTPGLSALQSAFIDQYHSIAIALGAEYGIPWEAVMAQGILESASGTSKYARERNNFFGINAVDSNPDKATRFASPLEGWRGYFEFIKKNSRYAKAGAFNYKNDPYGYIQAIKNAGYATDPNYVPKVSKLIKAVQYRANAKGWSNSSPCKTTLTYSQTINQVALELSWPDRTHDKKDPKPNYLSALKLVGLGNYGDTWVQIGASCDAFVATVLRYSKIDPNVRCCGAANMLAYFRSHPELYEKIPNLGNTSNMQPGDIRAKDSHVEIYVIDESGKAKIASASYGDRTSDHARAYYKDMAYQIFRFKGEK